LEREFLQDKINHFCARSVAEFPLLQFSHPGYLNGKIHLFTGLEMTATGDVSFSVFSLLQFSRPGYLRCKKHLFAGLEMTVLGGAGSWGLELKNP